MTRQEMKEIILKVIDKVNEAEQCDAPPPACIFADSPPDPCDVTTYYGIGEEA